MRNSPTINLFSFTLKKLGIECIYIDPNSSDEEINKALNNFFENKKKKDYKLKKKAALKIVKESTKYVDNIEVVGIEKLKNKIYKCAFENNDIVPLNVSDNIRNYVNNIDEYLKTVINYKNTKWLSLMLLCDDIL